MATDTIAKELLDFDRAMEEAEKKKAMHKIAFREAFNFLEAFYPPRDGEEYWEKVAKAGGEAANRNEGNPLILPLMITMMDYLGETWKERHQLC